MNTSTGEVRVMDRENRIVNYLQGRLAGDDHRAFEKAMTDDPKLAAEIDVMRAVRADLADAPQHPDAEAVWERLSDTIADKPRPANENRQPLAALLRYAAVALIAVAAWQFAVVLRLGEPTGGFRTASGETGAHVLQVKFRQDVTVAEIADLLTSVEGTIAEGPSALGIFRLSFADDPARAAALEALAARDDLVELVLEQ